MNESHKLWPVNKDSNSEAAIHSDLLEDYTNIRRMSYMDKGGVAMSLCSLLDYRSIAAKRYLTAGEELQNEIKVLINSVNRDIIQLMSLQELSTEPISLRQMNIERMRAIEVKEIYFKLTDE